MRFTQRTKVVTMVFMADSTTLTIKIDKSLKRNAQITANAIGIPLSTLINAYLKEIVSSGKVQFSATTAAPPQMKKIMAQVKTDEDATMKPVEFAGPWTKEQTENWITELS